MSPDRDSNAAELPPLPIAAGTWLRPVGCVPTHYIMVVSRSEADDDGIWIEYSVHSHDGHVSHGHSVAPLRWVRPGIWRDDFEFADGRRVWCPLYYRVCPPPAGVTADLFSSL